SLTKTDVCSYLAAVYGIQMMYIRTDNYIVPMHRTQSGAWVCNGKSYHIYKHGVIGLIEPFYY
ncbi:hypothetical protein F5888DRAFT_1600247, partial [Russula emetica]